VTQARELIVQRWFPTYDFVVRTPLSQKEAAARIEALVAPAPRPKGFVLGDRRIYGRSDGSLFRLYLGKSGLQGSVTVEGSLIPRDGGGTDIPVRVAMSRPWLVFVLFYTGAIVVSAIGQSGVRWLLGIPLLAAVTIGLQCLEGRHVSGVVESAFRG